MATGGKTLAGFKQELTCSICSNLFTEPKTLACLHTFCEACLSKHIKKRPLDDDSEPADVREKVPCPLCNHVQVLDRADVSLVKTNCGYKNMVDHLSLDERVRAGCGSSEGERVAKCDSCDDGNTAEAFCKTCNLHLCEMCLGSHRRERRYKTHTVVPLGDLSASSSDSQIVTHYTWKCDRHGGVEGSSEQLTEVVLYCKKCDEMICRECSIVEPHGNHEKFEAKKIIDDPECKPRIREREQKVAQVERKFTGFIAEMKDLQKQLKMHQEEAKMQIDARLKAIHKELEREKDELLKKVDRILNSKNKRLADQVSELEKIEKTLKDSRKVVNDTLAVGIPAEILFLMTQFIHRLQSLFDLYDTYDRKPRENDILQFNANAKFDLSGAIGSVTADPFPSAFTVESLESVHFIQGVKTSMTVTCRDIAGTPRPIKHSITVEMQPLAHGDVVLGQIDRDVERGIYAVDLQPIVHGKHELKVAVVVGNEKRPIDGSPFQVKVSRPVLQEIRAENIVVPGLENPWGVAVKRAVAKEGDGEGDGGGGEGDGEGEEGDGGGGEGDIGEGGAREGGGVVRCEGGAQQHDIIAVSDIGTNRIAVISNNDFQNPKWIGRAGEGRLEFKSPRGLAFNLDGHIAVVEKDNCRVQVVSMNGENGEFKFMFGKKGLGNGEFERPTDIVIGADGVMYVSDTDSNRIQYFNPNGVFVGSFGKWGLFNAPYALACDVFGRILITEQNGNRVQCWKPSALEASNSDHSSSSEAESEVNAQRQENFSCVFISEGLFKPVGIACHPETDYIIVTELKKHQLSILDKNGRSLCCTGDREFTSPMGVSVLGDSRVIVCDVEKRKIMIFHIALY